MSQGARWNLWIRRRDGSDRRGEEENRERVGVLRRTWAGMCQWENGRCGRFFGILMHGPMPAWAGASAPAAA